LVEDGPDSSSNGRAMKISNDTHFGDGRDPNFDDGWYIAGRMDYLGRRVILRNKEAQMVAAVLRQSRDLCHIEYQSCLFWPTPSTVYSQESDVSHGYGSLSAIGVFLVVIHYSSA
jgi:hypothetical protein